MRIYTIGFTGKTAAEFFEPLKRNHIKRLLDIRLKNTSQLAGFTKKNDLEYFLKEILGADYFHVPILAPAEELLKKYKSDNDWAYYEPEYLRLLDTRGVEKNIDRSLFDRDVVLLCSEETPERCHRRLAAEYLSKFLKPREIIHLGIPA